MAINFFLLNGLGSKVQGLYTLKPWPRPYSFGQISKWLPQKLFDISSANESGCLGRCFIDTRKLTDHRPLKGATSWIARCYQFATRRLVWLIKPANSKVIILLTLKRIAVYVLNSSNSPKPGNWKCKQRPQLDTLIGRPGSSLRVMHGLSCLQIVLLWGLLLDEAGCLDYAATKWMTNAGQWTPSGKYRIQTKFQLLIRRKKVQNFY